VLGLVVGGAAAVEAIVFLHDLPGAESLAPLILVAADDVAVTVAEHGGQVLALDTLCQQHRPLAFEGIVEYAPVVAHALEGRADLVPEIAVQIRQPLGVLTLSRDRDPAAELLHVVTVVVVGQRAVDDGLAALRCAHAAASAS
jgi:hypothetical protein